MYDGTHFTAIFESILDSMAKLGIKEPGPNTTATLVRDGFCTGRRFRFDDVGIDAVWLMADHAIHLRGKDGELLDTIDVRPDAQTQRRAA